MFGCCQGQTHSGDLCMRKLHQHAWVVMWHEATEMQSTWQLLFSWLQFGWQAVCWRDSLPSFRYSVCQCVCCLMSTDIAQVSWDEPRILSPFLHSFLTSLENKWSLSTDFPGLLSSTPGEGELQRIYQTSSGQWLYLWALTYSTSTFFSKIQNC